MKALKDKKHSFVLMFSLPGILVRPEGGYGEIIQWNGPKAEINLFY